MLQFALISLIPGLLRKLQDSADPELDSYEKSLVMPASLKTSERNSCMLFFLKGQVIRTHGNHSAILYGSPAAAVGNASCFQMTNVRVSKLIAVLYSQ